MKVFLLISSFLFSSIGIAQVHSYPVIKGKDREYHTGLRHKKKELQGLGELHFNFKAEDCEGLPEEFDLRKEGTVPSVKDQGGCGSCWSFSKTGSLESAIMAAGGKEVDLSEQELVSCDKTQWGCEGGLLSDFKYQINHGQGLEKDLPYTSGNGSNGRCKDIAVAGKGVSFAYVGAANRRPTLKEVKCALYKSKTIPWITVAAEGNWGQAPATEDKMFKSCGRGQTNHAIGIVGWKKIDGKEGMIIKNSWGKNWGAGGYAVMPLGCDNLGEEVAYIITENMPCKVPMVKLPATIETAKDIDVMLGVKEEKGVEYTWYKDEKEVGKGSMFYAKLSEGEAIYKLVGKTACGTSESSVKVKVVQ